MRLTILCLFIATSLAYSQRTNTFRNNLHKVGKILVIVEDIKNPRLEARISTDQIQTEIELQLRQNKIPISTKKADTLECVLDVEINSVPLADNPDGMIFLVELSLIKVVNLSNTTSKLGPVRLWEATSYGVVPIERSEFIGERIRDCTNSFLNDYLAANSN